MNDKAKKALDLIDEWGGVGGGHHKQWLLDQVARVLADDYESWVAEWESGEDGQNTYTWDVGIAP